MSTLPLPPETLAWLNHAADANQQDAQVMLHLLDRADAQDQWFTKFTDHYAKTIASVCRKLEALEALERGSSDRLIADTPAEDAPMVVDGPVVAALIEAESALADVAKGMAVSPRADECLHWAEARCTEALAVIRRVMRQHGIRTSDLAPAPTPPPADPAEKLVDRVISAMGRSTSFDNAYAAIREVADWLDTQGHQSGANAVRCELCR
jgi:hypothetical protein